jgi:hypothetical protein
MIACPVVLMLALAGCGSSKQSVSTARSTQPSTSETQPAPSQTSSTASTASEHLPVEDITLKSAVKLKPFPARYTCDGANVPPPFTWTKMPAGTKEIALFVLSALPVNNKYIVAWGVSGLSPHLRGLRSGQLPSGAIVGNNSFGQARYSVCPRKGAKQQYAVLLYGIPRKVSVKQGFDVEQLVEHKLVHIASSQSEIFFTYTRP